VAAGRRAVTPSLAQEVDAMPDPRARCTFAPALTCLTALSLCLAGTMRAAASPQGAPEGPARPAGSTKPPTIEEKTAGLQKLDGFFPLYWDATSGTLLMEVARLDTDVLYVTGLEAGVGSNDIGLDRGQGGSVQVVRFERVGPKLFLVEPNLRFRADTADPAVRRTVEESFARSIHWGFSIVAETSGRVLVDVTDFLLRDAHGIVQRLRPASFRIERSRSSIYLPRTKNFPKNTEIEAVLTYVTDGNTSGAGGGFGEGALAAVVPLDQAVTVRQHHSFVELPGPGFKPRLYDPRAGVSAFTYQDYAAPLGNQASMTRRLVRRHRLEKRDPTAKLTDPVRPIVYYLDRGVPEPLRSAILEGARWWNQAFEAAGYRNAFRVELLPDDADPMDVRYHVIQWVHRSTRGWSYGGSVTDPRTGEIIQGRVTLGSLRVRQDYLIFEGLLGPYRRGDETPREIDHLVLARLKQLAAHEVGHTLGFSHNYYASTQGRISVMDYPAPLVTLRPDGTLDVSNAYATGIGEWDKVAVAWAYQDFPPGTDEAAALRAILDEAWARDLRYMTNQDTDINPRADQWAHGTDPAAELERVLAVRRAALARFGQAALRREAPLALLEEALVPLYLHHRYQVEAAASALGGQHYVYAVRGDGREPAAQWVSAAEQRAALEALVKTLAPAELALPRPLLAHLPPRPSGYGRHRELFPRYTGGVFDALTPAVVAADLTVGFILQPERAARLVAQRALDPALPGLEEVIDRLVAAGFDAPASSPYEAEIRRLVGRVVADRLMTLAATAPMTQVRALATWKLGQLRDRLGQMGSTAPIAEAAHARLLAADITRFLERPAEPVRAPAPPSAPPGAPIGDPGPSWLPWLDEPFCSGGWAPPEGGLPER
jgi:hypothetical protein